MFSKSSSTRFSLSTIERVGIGVFLAVAVEVFVLVTVIVLVGHTIFVDVIEGFTVPIGVLTEATWVSDTFGEGAVDNRIFPELHPVMIRASITQQDSLVLRDFTSQKSRISVGFPFFSIES